MSLSRFVSRIALGATVLSTLAGPLAPPTAAQQSEPCFFTLGFKALRDQIPEIVGECRENEWHKADDGNTLQQTTGGLLVWRKADNWTAFTDGATSWVNGPLGLQSRPNSERFAWEADGQPTTGRAPAEPTSYRAASPEYGMNVFLWGNADTTQRDLRLLNQAGISWQKTLFQWRAIEGAGKGQYDWREADRVVAESTYRKVKIIARVDFQPDWARADGAHNGPPDNYQDYADFIYALVERYKDGSPHGRIHAVEIWNEPNLDREWGMAQIGPQSARDYVRLLKAGYEAAKAADPSVTVITAGLSPTCTNTAQARPDDLYLQWMYDAGAAAYFDVLGAHGAGYDKHPSVSPEESAARHAGCRVFSFRRVEDLRAVMERNGDGGKQVWLLEFGWTTDQVNPAYSWHAVTPDVHAEYVVDAFRWAHDHWPWIGVMTLWNMPDPNWTPAREEYWWSVTEPDGTPRPAFQRLATARRDGTLP